MKKKRSCQLLKTVYLVILGGLLIMGLAGCDVRKNSRAYLEGKAAELDRVFPTENLEDLFEEFPGGFEISILYTLSEDEEYAYSQTMDLKGNPISRKITGVIKNIKSTDRPIYRTEIEKESTFEYRNGQYVFDNPDFTTKEVATKGILIQYLPISKSILSNTKLLSKSYNWETSDGIIKYQLSDKNINQFLNIPNHKRVDMIIDINYETIHEDGYDYAVSLMFDNEVKYTLGFGGFKNTEESLNEK